MTTVSSNSGNITADGAPMSSSTATLNVVGAFFKKDKIPLSNINDSTNINDYNGTSNNNNSVSNNSDNLNDNNEGNNNNINASPGKKVVHHLGYENAHIAERAEKRRLRRTQKTDTIFLGINFTVVYQKMNQDRSLFIMARDNPIRKAANAVIVWRPAVIDRSWWTNIETERLSFFEIIMISFILLNTLSMALNSSTTYPPIIVSCDFPIPNPTPLPSGTKCTISNPTADIFNNINLVTNFVFTVEMIVYIIAFGLIIGNGSYLSDGWRVLDCFIVCICWLSYIPGFPNFKAFRAFRLLRAIRSIKVFSTCTAILVALYKAAPLLINVFAVGLLMLVIFSIMGIQLFRGDLLQVCTSINSSNSNTMMNPNYPSAWMCAGDFYGSGPPNLMPSAGGYICPLGFYCLRVQQNPNHGLSNFDNFISAVFTIFTMFSLEGWTGIMYQLQQSNNTWAWLYCVAIILIFAYLIVNLFISVLAMTFAEARNDADRRVLLIANQKLQAARLQALQEQEEEKEEEDNISKIKINDLYSADVIPTDIDDPNVNDDAIVINDNSEDRTPSPSSLPDTHPSATEEIPIIIPSPIPSSLSESDGDDDNIKKTLRTKDKQTSKSSSNIATVIELNMLPQSGIKALQKQTGIDNDEQKGSYELNDDRVKVVTVDSLALELSRQQLGGDMEEQMIHDTEKKLKEIDNQLHVRKKGGGPPLFETDIPIPTGENMIVWICYRIVTVPIFTYGICIIIFVNALFLAAQYYGMSDSYLSALDWANVGFTGIYVLEFILKLIAYQGSRYFGPLSNKFDFIIVVIGVPFCIQTIFGVNVGFFSSLEFLRVFRLFRTFRLIRRLTSLLSVVASSLKAMGNLAVFVVFFNIIYGIFGMQLYGGAGNFIMADTNPCCYYEPRLNFDTFPNAFITLFTVMTGENWTDVLYNCTTNIPSYGWLYMTIYFCFAMYILLQMFVAVILENFELEEELKLLRQRREFVKLQEHLRLKKIQTTMREKEAELQHAKNPTKHEPEVSITSLDIFDPLHAGEYTAIDGRPEVSDLSKVPGSQYLLYDEIDPPIADNNVRIVVHKHVGHKHALKDANEEKLSNENLNRDRGILPVPAGHPDDPLVVFLSIDEMIEQEEFGEEEYDDASLYLFEPENRFRKFLLRILTSRYFDYCMLSVIFYSSVVLALYTPYLPYSFPIVTTISDWSDPVILGIFTTELIMKLIGFGFIGTNHAYLKSTWNCVDFFVLAVSYIAYFITDVPNSIGRVFRLLRVLRVLRLINRSERLQLVFFAVYRALLPMANVYILFLYFIFVFGVVGLNIFSGLFHYCTDRNLTNFPTPDFGSNYANCQGTAASLGYALQTAPNYSFPPTFFPGMFIPKAWVNVHYNFDNIGWAMWTLFTVNTTEGWIYVMWSGMDCTSDKMAPVQNASYWNCLFFICYMAFVNFFILNLVVGIIVDTFNQLSGDGLLTEEQTRWKHVSKNLALKGFDPPIDPPTNKFRLSCYNLLKHRYFDIASMILIILNTILMATEHYPQSPTWDDAQTYGNWAFVVCFTIELLIRMIGLGPKLFFTGVSKKWNIFDFVIIVGSILTLAIPNSVINIQSLRPIRLLLVFRIVRTHSGIRLMLSTFLSALPGMGNVGCFAFIVWFMSGVLFCQLFGNVMLQIFTTEYSNYRSFPLAVLTLFRNVTGENINEIMFENMIESPYCTNFDIPYTYDADTPYYPNDCGNLILAVIFFIFFYCVATFIVINLTIAVILDNFNFCYSIEESLLSKSVLQLFDDCWLECSDPHTLLLPLYKLKSFLYSIGLPLGLDESSVASRFRIIHAECLLRCRSDWMGNKDKIGIVPKLTIGYTQLLFILSLHCVGLDPLPYDLRVQRNNEILDILALSARLTLCGVIRGKKERRELTEITGIDYIGDSKTREQRRVRYLERTSKTRYLSEADEREKLRRQSAKQKKDRLFGAAVESDAKHYNNREIIPDVEIDKNPKKTVLERMASLGFIVKVGAGNGGSGGSVAESDLNKNDSGVARDSDLRNVIGESTLKQLSDISETESHSYEILPRSDLQLAPISSHLSSAPRSQILDPSQLAFLNNYQRQLLFPEVEISDRLSDAMRSTRRTSRFSRRQGVSTGETSSTPTPRVGPSVPASPLMGTDERNQANNLGDIPFSRNQSSKK